MNARVSPAVAAILDAALRGELTETQAVLMGVYHYRTRLGGPSFARRSGLPAFAADAAASAE